MRFIGILIICLLTFSVQAEIPSEYKRIIKEYKFQPDSFTFIVKNLSNKSEVIISHNEKKLFNPASLAKIISTYVAIKKLGPQFKWKSDFLHNGEIVGNALFGDVIFKGRGDATFSIAKLEESIRKIQQKGLKEINGNLILDLSYFGKISKVKSFDNDPMRAYNALPNSVVIQSNTMNFTFGVKDKILNIKSTPELDNLEIKNNVKITKGRCVDWKSKLNYRTKKNKSKTIIIFDGNYSRHCGIKEFDLTVLEDNEYFYQVFKKIWNDNGGKFDGKLEETYLPNLNWKFLYSHFSNPLSEVVRHVNKYSLNLMARNIMLTVLAEDNKPLVIETSLNDFIHSWFKKNDLLHEGIIFENGAGLSRNSVISSEQLLLLMEKIYYDPLMPEIIASFPISGIDGTLKKRMNYSSYKMSGHFKTGSIKNVSAIAGFLLDKNKDMKIFIFMMNDKKAKDSRFFQEALIAEAYK